MIDTATLRKLLAETTQGEWYVLTDSVGGDEEPIETFSCGIGSRFEGEEVYPVFDHNGPYVTDKDAAFIAAAHNTLPALLDELDRLRAFVAEKGVAYGIYNDDMSDADYRCLNCGARSFYEAEGYIKHAPSCIVAEARAAVAKENSGG